MKSIIKNRENRPFFSGHTAGISKMMSKGTTQKIALCAGYRNLFLMILICVFIFTFIGCIPRQSKFTNSENISDYDAAQNTLLEFLNNLHEGKYVQAANYFGGEYQILIDQNPTTDPTDHETLWRNGCTINGMQCLRAKIIGGQEETPSERYIFLVEFEKQDGTLFQSGPCCGSDEAGSPPLSVFTFTVIKSEGSKYSVLDMPPYAP
jgi:hypothetical protein